MFCGNCGKEIQTGNKFCNHCGHEINDAYVTSSEVVDEKQSDLKDWGKTYKVFLYIYSAITILLNLFVFGIDPTEYNFGYFIGSSISTVLIAALFVYLINKKSSTALTVLLILRVYGTFLTLYDIANDANSFYMFALILQVIDVTLLYKTINHIKLSKTNR